MNSVTKEQRGSALVVSISGSIEDSVNFESLIGPPPLELHVYCSEITRINSVGVKTWIKYFQSCKAAGTKLKFVECSTAVVDQINQISNFACEGIIESIQVPFSCTSCKNQQDVLFTTEELKRLKCVLPEQKCSQCGALTVFSDIAAEYFGFLSR